MRRALLRVLLIALVLNSAIGMPLHAAVHLVDAAAVQSLPGTPAGVAEEGEDQDTAHASCAWCQAHAQASGAPPSQPGASLPADGGASHERPARAVVPAFSAGLWSSSPRGPPSC